MISIKSHTEIEKLRKAGYITAGALDAAGNAIHAGMTTRELDRVVEKYITSHGAKPGFKGIFKLIKLIVDACKALLKKITE